MADTPYQKTGVEMIVPGGFGAAGSRRLSRQAAGCCGSRTGTISRRSPTKAAVRMIPSTPLAGWRIRELPFSRCRQHVAGARRRRQQPACLLDHGRDGGLVRRRHDVHAGDAGDGRKLGDQLDADALAFR